MWTDKIGGGLAISVIEIVNRVHKTVNNKIHVGHCNVQLKTNIFYYKIFSTFWVLMNGIEYAAHKNIDNCFDLQVTIFGNKYRIKCIHSTLTKRTLQKVERDFPCYFVDKFNILYAFICNP